MKDTICGRLTDGHALDERRMAQSSKNNDAGNQRRHGIEQTQAKGISNERIVKAVITGERHQTTVGDTHGHKSLRQSVYPYLGNVETINSLDDRTR